MSVSKIELAAINGMAQALHLSFKDDMIVILESVRK